MRDVAMENKHSGNKYVRRGRPEAFALSLTRTEAQRQFRLSFALVIMVTIGMLFVVATMPVGEWEESYGIGRVSQVQP
jgi:hypothetical protein